MRIRIRLAGNGIDDDYRLITQAECGVRAEGHEVKEIRCSAGDYDRIISMQENARERMRRYDVPWVRQMLEERDEHGGMVAFGTPVVKSARISPGTLIVVGD